PEPLDGRNRALSKRDRIATRPVQPRTARVEVLIEIGRLLRLVDENVRLGNGGACEVVGSEPGAVSLGRPLVWQWQSVASELKERCDQFLVCLDRDLSQGVLELRILRRRIEHGPDLSVASL